MKESDFSMTYEDLIKDIQEAAEQGVTLDNAERIAAKSLFVMNDISEALKLADRDRRMRKTGLKAIRSAVRLEEVKKQEKKPTEGALEDVVNTSEIIIKEEDGFNNAELESEELERRFSIARESHIYFRGVSKGRFEG